MIFVAKKAQTETADNASFTNKNGDQRGKIIIRTSFVGIAANVFLAAFKAIVGFASNSIAIVLDAVNNITDAASSLITIIGTKLAGKAPDRKHPFGHGRVEYLSAMLISVLVLYAGLASLTESVKKILHPQTPDYSVAAIVIVAVAVAVKIVLGLFVKRTGEKVNSESLFNSGKDAMLDAVISAATLVAAGIYLWKGISLESYLAAAISLVIIKSGVDMLRSTISELLGERVDAQLANDIRKTVISFPQVQGVYDLVLHNYGPENYNGSVHIEVPDDMDAKEIDVLIREITYEVYQRHQVILTAIGVYAFNSKDPVALQMRNDVQQLLSKYPQVLQMHGFNVDNEKMILRFDVILGFDAKDRFQTYETICDEVQKQYPDYKIIIVLDADFSEAAE